MVAFDSRVNVLFSINKQITQDFNKKKVSPVYNNNNNNHKLNSPSRQNCYLPTRQHKLRLKITGSVQ